jgi:ferredoxin
MEDRKLTPEHLNQLLQSLRTSGFRIVGPVAAEHALRLDEIHELSDLPFGKGVRTEAGRYRVESTGKSTYFGYNLTADSFKKFLFPPIRNLFSVSLDSSDAPFIKDTAEPPETVFLGIRSCELHALAMQDKIFTGGAYRDEFYAAQRKKIFIFAVQCGHANDTCFCASAGTGPAVTLDYDLLLTELSGGNGSFIVRAGSDKGRGFLERLDAKPASEKDQQDAADLVKNTASSMKRSLPFQGLHERLRDYGDMKHWQEVATRCLSCGNCTNSCPTCFCNTVEDTVHYTGSEAKRVRKWDTCFSEGHSYIHGTTVRASVSSRYRQWLTHKLSTWVDQFDASGCVGCGRCITWCPAEIDITVETNRLLAEKPEKMESPFPV